MKKISLFLLFSAVLASCSGLHFADRVPLSARPQILSRYESRLDYTPWPKSVMDDRNLTGRGGNFIHWNQHKAEAQSGNELHELCNLSDDLLSRISTRNLARTCYIYPYNIDFFTYPDEFFGTLATMGRFNGYRALMQRKSAPAELLHLYQELHYPKSAPETSHNMVLASSDYLDEAQAFFGIGYLTQVLITAVDYGCFSADEIKRLADEVGNKMEDVVGSPEGLYSWLGAIRHPYVLGAFIAYHHDTKLTADEVALLVDFIDPYSTEGVYHTPGIPVTQDPEILTRTTAIIIRSLARLH